MNRLHLDKKTHYILLTFLDGKHQSQDIWEQGRPSFLNGKMLSNCLHAVDWHTLHPFIFEKFCRMNRPDNLQLEVYKQLISRK